MSQERLSVVAGATGFLDPAHVRRIGTVLTLAGAVTAELLAEPFDLVWIDLEHGALGLGDAQDMILGAQAAGASALVRVGLARAAGLIGPMLDAGADGIVAADIKSGSQAELIASLMRRPPAGRRGYGPRRVATRRRSRTQAADAPQLWLQIESQEGVAATREIAATGVTDTVIVGIADLCVDLGIPIALDDPRLHDALWAVGDTAVRMKCRFGLAGPLQPVGQLGDLLGIASVLMHSTDARLCAASVDRAAAALRSALRTGPSTQGVRSSG